MAHVFISYATPDRVIADEQLIPLRAEAGVVHPLMQRLQDVDYPADPRQARDRVLQTVRLLDDGSGAWREGDNTLPGIGTVHRSADKTVILWDLPRLAGFPGGEVREACLRAGGALDKTTWDQYAPGVSYQDTCADQ
ncbi:MAG: hypothetical protein ACRDRI_03300 [Pseudonocardiaceae bacterium]